MGMTGADSAAITAAMAMITKRGASAQLMVLHHGEVVIDQAWGVAPDVPFLLFSAGKPFVAVLTHRLAEQGIIGLDHPVARYWPEFAANGKTEITVRQVLQHRSGLPYAGSLLRDALACRDWDRSVRALAAARPVHEPGTVPAYHTLSYGFLLGEVIRRATGEPLRDVMHRELFAPLGLRHTHLGTPPDRWPHRVPLRGAAGPQQFLFNRRGAREAVIPAASMSATARDLARFYQGLLDNTVLNDLAQAVAPSSEGEVDRTVGRTVRWSAGFQLGGPDGDPTRVRPLGRLTSPRTFGHNGSNACLGWADPDRRLVVAYVTNRLTRTQAASPHLCALSDTLVRAADSF
jgi:CubicO group peptidase (beta-lactamase class C family)